MKKYGHRLAALALAVCAVFSLNVTVLADDIELWSVKPTMAQPFDDVPLDAYYLNPVLWAVANGVTNGTSATTFSPAATVTRGQTVTFLWRAAGFPEPSSTKNPFTDVKESDYYYKAVLWAVEKGITQGTGDTTFSPAMTCSRAHIVTFLHRAKGTPAATGASALAAAYPDSAWYKAAVAWADGTGLLSGTAEAFSAEANCPRADVVTYLYRAYQ